MPQLDIVTFFSQFFWLCFFFIGFYYILYKYFLPQYSRCILFRDKFTRSSITGSSANIEEKGNIEESLYMYTTSAVGFSTFFFQESKRGGLEWQKSCSKQNQENTWKVPNTLYVKTFGAKGASKNLSKSSISYIVGMSVYMEGLSKTCLSYVSKSFSTLEASKKSNGSLNDFHRTEKNKSFAQKNVKGLQKQEGKPETQNLKLSKKSSNNTTHNPKTGTGKSNTSKK